MTIDYFPDTDTLYIALRSGQSDDATEVAPDLVLDLDSDGSVIGMTIERAGERVDLNSLSVLKIPALAA